MALLVACSSGATTTQLAARHAWARPTPQGATNGVVYLDVSSPSADSIVSAAVTPDVAAGAELHETMVTGGTSPMANMPQMAGDGTMTMAPVSAVPIPAHSEVHFTPGGLHIMLAGLHRQLALGDHFTITLHLQHGGNLTADVVVANEAPAR